MKKKYLIIISVLVLILVVAVSVFAIYKYKNRDITLYFEGEAKNFTFSLGEVKISEIDPYYIIDNFALKEDSDFKIEDYDKFQLIIYYDEDTMFGSHTYTSNNGDFTEWLKSIEISEYTAPACKNKKNSANCEESFIEKQNITEDNFTDKFIIKARYCTKDNKCKIEKFIIHEKNLEE